MSNSSIHQTIALDTHGFKCLVATRVSCLDGLNVHDGRSWIRLRPVGSLHRWRRRGSIGLSGRKPKNKNLPMAGLNRRLGTRLYGIEVQIDADNMIYVQIRGVRISDVTTYLQDEVGLQPSQWELLHYNNVERMVAVAPVDAYRLAEELGFEGRCRAKRKVFLLRDVSVSVVTPK